LVIGARSTGVRLTSVTPTANQYTLQTTSVVTAQTDSVNELITGTDVTVSQFGGNALVKYFWYGVRVLGPANRPGMTV